MVAHVDLINNTTKKNKAKAQEMRQMNKKVCRW